MRLVWLVVGLLCGLAAGRNVGDIPAPTLGAAVLVAVLCFWLAWRAGNRDRATAVATAVSVAQAEAQATLDAALSAQATATGGSVQLVMVDSADAARSRLVAVRGGQEDDDQVASVVGRHAVGKAEARIVPADELAGGRPPAVAPAPAGFVGPRGGHGAIGAQNEPEAEPWYP